MGLLMATTSFMAACNQPSDNSSNPGSNSGSNSGSATQTAIVEDIAVKTPPKTEYILGETFEIDGGG